MSNNTEIETYLKDLSRFLQGLPKSEREDIADEIRAHLEQRQCEDRLEETMQALGSAEQCARGFYEQRQIDVALREGGIARTVSTLANFATKRLLAAIGLATSSVLFAFAIAFGCIAVAEIMAPQHVGLWLNSKGGVYRFGITSTPPKDEYVEVLGLGITPLAVVLAVGAMVGGHSIGRFCLTRLRINS